MATATSRVAFRLVLALHCLVHRPRPSSVLATGPTKAIQETTTTTTTTTAPRASASTAARTVDDVDFYGVVVHTTPLIQELGAGIR